MILSAQPFIPHSYAHIIEAGVFPPSSMPEAAYDKLLRDYAALDDVTISRITYPSDGLRVTGLMAVPATLNAAYPLLLYNRGGSREYGKLTVLSALRSMAPFARAGYVVFASNYRGNDGGDGQEEFGGRDVDDVLNLLALAEQHPAFDGHNRFMLGHSRGGMMTALAIKRGACLNAAILIAGIADAHALQTPSMIEHVLHPLVPDYDADPQAALRARSAIDWPQALTVPLLLLHGEADTVVPPEQSVQLAAAIQHSGGQSELHLYPGGNHALVRHWDDVLARSLAWMERYRT